MEEFFDEFKKTQEIFSIDSSWFKSFSCQRGVICQQPRAQIPQYFLELEKIVYMYNPKMTLIINFVKFFSDKFSEPYYKDTMELLYNVFDTCIIEYLIPVEQLCEHLKNNNIPATDYYVIHRAELKLEIFWLLRECCNAEPFRFFLCCNTVRTLSELCDKKYHGGYPDNDTVMTASLLQVLDKAKSKLADSATVAANPRFEDQTTERCNQLLTDGIYFVKNMNRL